jgi:hypothetical protein
LLPLNGNGRLAIVSPLSQRWILKKKTEYGADQRQAPFCRGGRSASHHTACDLRFRRVDKSPASAAASENRDFGASAPPPPSVFGERRFPGEVITEKRQSGIADIAERILLAINALIARLQRFASSTGRRPSRPRRRRRSRAA